MTVCWFKSSWVRWLCSFKMKGYIGYILLDDSGGTSQRTIQLKTLGRHLELQVRVLLEPLCLSLTWQMYTTRLVECRARLQRVIGIVVQYIRQHDPLCVREGGVQISRCRYAIFQTIAEPCKVNLLVEGGSNFRTCLLTPAHSLSVKTRRYQVEWKVQLLLSQWVLSHPQINIHVPET